MDLFAEGKNECPVPPWVCFTAWSTVVLALPLVILGAETTTKGVGMADLVSLRTPWYFFTLNLKQTSLGLLIEHSHRLFGWAVGISCLIFAFSLQYSGRGWVRYLGWLALFLVAAQGILGILRVKWNAMAGPELAAFHGCFAQFTFACLVSIAVVCSAFWWNAESTGDPNLKPLIGYLLFALIFSQMILGAIVRHKMDPLAQRGHIILAFAVVVLVIWCFMRLRDGEDSLAHKVVGVLLFLVSIQPILGVEAWIRKFGSGQPPMLVPSDPTLDLVRTVHHFTGMLILAAAGSLAAILCRSLIIFKRSSSEASVATVGGAH
ncbi:MAG: COX15/CtaA family protein [Gemmataceae bacterium]